MNAVVLTRDGRGRSIDASDIVATVQAGEVVVLPQAMQHIGLQREIVAAMIGAIRDSCGAAAAEEVRRRGLEKLHQVLQRDQIERAAHAADQRLQAWYPRLVKAIGRDALGLRRSFYVPMIPVTRFSIPTERASAAERFALEKTAVLLNRFPPHRDSWFSSPINTLNVWIAIGAVEHGNGLCFYPDMWAREVTLETRDGRDFGVPLTIALEAGDIAVFDNRQLHATAENVGSSTRIALSGRICPTAPIAPRADALDVVSLWSPLIGTRFERFAGAATKVSWTYALERLKRRATRVVAALEGRTEGTRLRAVQRALRYRRADRLFDK